MAEINEVRLSLAERLFAFEEDRCDGWEDTDITALYQDLLDSGLIFSLQGSHQRFCQHLMSLGLVAVREPAAWSEPGEDAYSVTY
jgi:hypothetical protein